ncbi:MAG: alpha/beta hydrolase [Acidimicrobiia bacterium]|nr:alpha/beta hydrolase [Acidimicrobiia bacterium]
MPEAKIGRFKSDEARAKFFKMYDEMLTNWPVPSEELDVETDFGTTHVRRSGKAGGSPIVLVHPNIGTSLAWWRLVEPLAASHNVLALDTIGALGRSRQTKPIAGSSEYAAWLNGVIEQLDLDAPHLVGYSEGGYVAMCSALGSTTIGSLVAIEPGGAIDRVSRRFLGAMVVAGVKAQFSDYALQEFAERISPGVEFAPGEMEAVLFGAKNFRQGLPFPKRFTDDELQRITVPTLFYMGGKTELYNPVSAAERAQRLMPDVETLIVPDAQHGLPFQYPELTTMTILDFIERVEAR